LALPFAILAYTFGEPDSQVAKYRRDHILLFVQTMPGDDDGHMTIFLGGSLSLPWRVIVVRFGSD
jgi:hypothetical protein